ncbi:MAG: hypothetical protein NWQ53_08840, partial [Flavobacteriales bacterium]|nr:hypothetical protein [Flavobacteriales bacterium]
AFFCCAKALVVSAIIAAVVIHFFIFFKIKVYQVSGTQVEDELNSVMLHLPSWNASKLAFFCIPRL